MSFKAIHLMHHASFVAVKLQPASSGFMKRVGSPGREWRTDVGKNALEFGTVTVKCPDLNRILWCGVNRCAGPYMSTCRLGYD